MADNTPYQRLSAAGQALRGAEIFQALAEPQSAQGEQFLEQNRAALALARAALRETCEVPLEYEAAFIGRHLADLQALRMLGKSFRLESQLHAAREDWQGAAGAALDLLRLAGATRRGGLRVDALTSVALEANAVDQLVELLPRLGAESARQIAGALAQYDLEREPSTAIECRERNWDAHVEPDEPPDFLNLPWPEGVEPELDAESELALRQALQAMADLPADEHRALLEEFDDERLLVLRKLTIQAALAGFHAVRNAYPESLSELVPDWLPAVPVDPRDAGRLAYGRTGAGYALAVPG